MISHGSTKSNFVGKYKKKVTKIKQLIREYVHENAALCDEINDVQETILIRNEERKFLLKKLCLFDSLVEQEVEALSKSLFSHSQSNPSPVDSKKSKRKHNSGNDHQDRKSSSSRHRKSSSSRQKKKYIHPIPLDPTGRPIFPIELGSLTIVSLGDVISDRKEFHCEEVIYPAGFISKKIYGSLKNPTVKCVYTCRVLEVSGSPRFEVTSEESGQSITGATPDVCHTLLLQKINDTLSLNVVTTRPKGNDFFGLSHPNVLNLIQCSPNAKKCTNYKWNRFEMSKTGDARDSSDGTLSYELLQKSIDNCKFKMGPSSESDFYENKSSFWMN